MLQQHHAPHQSHKFLGDAICLVFNSCAQPIRAQSFPEFILTPGASKVRVGSNFFRSDFSWCAYCRFSAGKFAPHHPLYGLRLFPLVLERSTYFLLRRLFGRVWHPVHKPSIDLGRVCQESQGRCGLGETVCNFSIHRNDYGAYLVQRCSSCESGPVFVCGTGSFACTLLADTQRLNVMPICVQAILAMFAIKGASNQYRCRQREWQAVASLHEACLLREAIEKVAK